MTSLYRNSGRRAHQEDGPSWSIKTIFIVLILLTALILYVGSRLS